MLTEAQRAALTARLRRGRVVAGGVARRDPGTASLPPSFGQQQLWFIDRFAPGQAMYNIPLAIGVSGELDEAALGRAVDLLVARHEALRTRLVTGHGGDPEQVIDPPGPVPVPLTDLTDLSAGSDRLRALIDAEAVRPFSLRDGPLIRFSLIRLVGDGHVLLIVVHHVVFDGWSAGVLLRDLAALYRAQASGEPAGLADLPVQFADYALWERALWERAQWERAQWERARLDGDVAGYWREALDGFETVRFPVDRPRPLVEDWAGGLAVRMTGPGLLEDLRELSRRYSATLFVTLMAGLQALLYRYTGQHDVVVGTVSANRGRPELAPLVGFLVNTLPIRTDLSGDPPFSELIDRVKRVTTGAYGHQELPFGKMVEVLKVDRDPSRAPVFQISLTYAERDATPIEAAGATFAMTDLVAGIYAAKFDLSFHAEARSSPGQQGGLWLECSYKTALFEADTIERLLLHLELLLRGAADRPRPRLSELPMLTPAEHAAELVTWNDSARQYPQECVHEAFERQARRTPDAVAAEYEGERLSYAQLDGLASRVAARLRELGVGPESLVGVCMPACLARLAAFLGIWKAGGGYVPLDSRFPPDRLGYLIQDTGMTVVVADEASVRCLPAPPGLPVLELGIGGDWAASLPEAAAGQQRALSSPANVAYVLYTSGSTGQPKGVVIEHRHAVNFLHAMIDLWQPGPADVVVQFSAFTFDVSVLDTFMPLLAGAKVLLAPADTLHTPRRLVALLRDHGVTIAALTPSVAAAMLGDADLPRLRTLMLGGEELTSELVLRLRRPDRRIVNIYGPTEVTVVSTQTAVDGQLPPSIGYPTPNYQAYVLDEHLNPVPTGVMGELHLGGASVGRGYLNRPALTAERFTGDPFHPGERLYKTGDLCFRRRDGSIMFCGRADHQVKLRGLRIELGEIEVVTLAACPGVDQAVVLVVSGALVAYVRPADVDLAAVRARLAAVLPPYMIPERFVTLAEFPLNASGKVDRRALPVPGAVREGGPAAEPPATATEAAVIELFGTVLSGTALAGAGQSATVGPGDNFFASGGNSLLVMRLIDLIAGRTGADLTPAAVFLYPTPRQLAGQIDAALASPSRGPAGHLVPLTAATGPDGPGGNPPLILIHAIGGTITDYTALAGELSDGYSAHGLQAPGISEPGTTPATFGELAARYTEMITAAFPDGPYYLAGWSMGGVIAYEVTILLERDGAEVGLLTLLDAPFSVPAGRRCDEEYLTGQFVRDAGQSLGLDAVPDGPTSRQLAWLAGMLGGDDSLTAQLRRRLDVFSAHWKLMTGYEPAAPVRVPAVVVSASDSPNTPAGARWSALLSGRLVVVDGDHYSFLRPPAVGAVAEAMLTRPSVGNLAADIRA